MDGKLGTLQDTGRFSFDFSQFLFFIPGLHQIVRQGQNKRGPSYWGLILLVPSINRGQMGLS